MIKRLVALTALSLALLAVEARAQLLVTVDGATALAADRWHSDLESWMTIVQSGDMSGSKWRAKCVTLRTARFRCFTGARVKDDRFLASDRHFDCQGRYRVTVRRGIPSIVQTKFDCLEL